MHGALDLHTNRTDPVLPRRSDTARRQRSRIEASTAVAVVEGDHERVEWREWCKIGPRPGDRAVVVRVDRSHARFFPERRRHVAGQHRRSGRTIKTSVDGLNSVGVRLRCAKSGSESEMCVHLAGALADEFSAHVRRGDERSHSGGRHRGVPHSECAGCAGLVMQAREVRVVAVSLCDVQTVFSAGATRRVGRSEAGQLDSPPPGFVRTLNEF